MVLASACATSRALEGLLEPGIPAAETRHVLALRHIEVTSYREMKTELKTYLASKQMQQRIKASSSSSWYLSKSLAGTLR